MVDTSLGDKYRKAELEYDRRIERDGCYIGFRLDGRAFHTLTARYKKPFDDRFIEAMLAACRSVFDSLSGFDIVCAYVASDEISVITWIPKESVIAGTIPFGGRLEKIVACVSSYASIYFDRSLSLSGADYYANADTDGYTRPWYPFGISSMPCRRSLMVPTFDCRAFKLENADDIERYLTWRRMDCMRNAVSAASTALFGHKATLNKTTEERREMLIGTEYERIDERAYRGTLMRVVELAVPTPYIDKRNGKSRIGKANRSFIKSMDGTKENAADIIREFDATKRESIK